MSEGNTSDGFNQQVFVDYRLITERLVQLTKGEKTGRQRTSSCNGIEANPPRYAERRKAFDQADHRRFTTQIRIPSPRMAQKARSTCSGNHLTFAPLVAAFVALVQQLQECKNGIIQSRAVETIYVSEICHGCLPCVLHKIRQGVPRFQVLEHWPCHSCVGNQDVYVADIVTYMGGHGLQIFL